jgi:hypothetical protein
MTEDEKKNMDDLKKSVEDKQTELEKSIMDLHT